LDFGRGIGIDAAPICGREFAVGCGEFIGFGEVELLFCAVLNSEELIAGYDFESVAGAVGAGALIVGQRRRVCPWRFGNSRVNRSASLA
jgi:hypothetical protein